MNTRVFSSVILAALAALAFAATPGSADAQAFESDREFESRIKSEIRSVRRRIEKFREELTGDNATEPGRRGTGLYPGIVARLQGLEKRCDFQEEYVERMAPSSMRSPYDVQRERNAIRDDIRMVQRELGRIKNDMEKLDEESEKEDRERAEREALEKEIMEEEW